MSGSRRTGKIKFFSQDKGFGFITPDSGGKDLFLHVKALPDGMQTIAADTRVSFETESAPKGPKAVQVEVVR